MRLFLISLLVLLLASPAIAWQSDSVNGKLVLRQHCVIKGGPLVRGGAGAQAAVLYAATSWMHFQVNAGATTTLIADSAFAKRVYGMLNSEIRFHFPNSYTFRGKFVGLYYAYSEGTHTYKKTELIGNSAVKHFTRYRSHAHIAGVVLGGSGVGKRYDYLYLEGFVAAGYALNITVSGFDTQYFPDLHTPIARRDRLELKCGIMLGIVGW